jgi:hypothetical protein
MQLLRGLCSTSASSRASSTGSTWFAKRPREPLLRPYQPSTGCAVPRGAQDASANRDREGSNPAEHVVDGALHLAKLEPLDPIGERV